jgi:hypothetical protein
VYIKMCRQWFFINLYGYLGPVKRVYGHTEVTYWIGMKRYKIIILSKFNFNPIDTILGEDGDDVTDEVFEYLGPCFDFHNVNVTPKMMGYNDLEFHYIDGTLKSFNANQTIKF